jgi:hypothetical protein
MDFNRYDVCSQPDVSLDLSKRILTDTVCGSHVVVVLLIEFVEDFTFTERSVSAVTKNCCDNKKINVETKNCGQIIRAILNGLISTPVANEILDRL